VSVGDTPWDAETYDVTELLRAGSNTVEVTADAKTPNPKKRYNWLRPAPSRLPRLLRGCALSKRAAHGPTSGSMSKSSTITDVLRASTAWNASAPI
jgi:hypothetical protein